MQMTSDSCGFGERWFRRRALNQSLSDGDQAMTQCCPDASGRTGLTTIGVPLGSVLHLAETMGVDVPGRVDEISIHGLLLRWSG